MKKYFVVSLIRNGILGGGIAADDEAITYHTGKVTVSKELRRIEMKYGDIRAFAAERFLLMPSVRIALADGREYRFIVFARKRFMDLLKRMGAGE